MKNIERSFHCICVCQHSGKNFEPVFWALKLVRMFTEPRIFQNMPESGDFSTKVIICVPTQWRKILKPSLISRSDVHKTSHLTKNARIWWFLMERRGKNGEKLVSICDFLEKNKTDTQSNTPNQHNFPEFEAYWNFIQICLSGPKFSNLKFLNRGNF